LKNFIVKNKKTTDGSTNQILEVVEKGEWNVSKIKN